MYKYRDTKRDIPNSFAPDMDNVDFCIPEIISIIGKGCVERKDVPHDVLKRVDAEIEFIRKTQVEKTKPISA